MKTINFSVVDILPSLLDKTKSQVIEPAWGLLEDNELFDEHIKRCPACYARYRIYEKGGRYPTNEELESERGVINKICNETAKYMQENPPIKPPRFKVEDKVKLYWNQRSKYEWFCKCCREESNKCKTYSNLIEKYYPELFFNKQLGTGVIIEVFEIGMSKELQNPRGGYNISFSCPFPKDMTESIKLVTDKETNFTTTEDIYKLAKRDGFQSAEQMFNKLDEMYDLAEGKKFYVYRWKWDK